MGDFCRNSAVAESTPCLPKVGLESLPVELFYELQLFALSEHLPYTSRHIHGIFHSTRASFRSEYLLGRAVAVSIDPSVSTIFTRVLRYPICSQEVLEVLCKRLPKEEHTRRVELPRRLFRSLAPKVGAIQWKEREHPMPFVRYLFESAALPPLNINAHEGYALTKAVHAKFIPLVRYLLRQGAEPQRKEGLVVHVAIRQKDLGLVKTLVEREDSPYEENRGKRKRRKMEDRVVVDREMLKTAVKCDARDIVEYFTREKGCIPDIETLRMMMR
ncbi:hypothetical protein H0H81_006945 [Sphagnurus paluster]|uniref:Uncharacterized protein n=1 Tax=Sphagnurus paluster TaxID=117069 RepID=A0A9P7FT15_9AGAR|nr:hypothetical protein H0H81_006945 [Sphagnurus paluster]